MRIRFIAPSALIVLALAACQSSTPSASSPYVPGATGQTMVPGTNSSVASDAPATRDTQTGQSSTGASGGGSGK
jgi:hypothetical protein